MTATCAAPGCDNPIVRRPGQPGRPPIYCTPACRPSRARPPLTIEVGPDSDQPDTRGWTVTIRRGQRAVTVATALGRFSAAALADDLAPLLDADIEPRP